MTAYTVPIDIRFKDVDGLGHVNNATYLTFLEHARMKFFTKEGGSTSERDFPFILAHAAIDYIQPLGINDEVEVKFWTSRVGNKSWDFDYEIRGRETGELFATGKTVQVAYDYEIQESTRLGGKLKTLVERLVPDPFAKP